jgi:hypothetical protein
VTLRLATAMINPPTASSTAARRHETPTDGSCQRASRRLSEEITIPASDQQSQAPVHNDLD